MRVMVSALYRSLLRAALAAATVSVFGACAVQQFEQAGAGSLIVNACTTDDDCRTQNGADGICGPGKCIAAKGNIDSAIVEIIPAASAFYGAGDSFLIPLENLSRGDWSRSITLPNYAKLTGKVGADAALFGDPPSEACEQAFDAASETLKVHVELTRSDAIHGLPLVSFAANAQQKGSGWIFDVDLPAGRYDIYTTVLAGCDADFPPLLTPSQNLEPGDVTIETTVGALSTLSGTVSAPLRQQNDPTAFVSLTDWTISLIEPGLGRLISTKRKLNDSNPTNFQLRFQPLDGISPLVEIAPPEGVIAPTVLWDLSVLDLDGDGQVHPDLSKLDLTTVHVRGRVVGPSVEPIAGASVKLRTTQITGAMQGLSARYETSLVTGDDGAIDVSLLPGTYQVLVTPPGTTGLAIAVAEWIIPRSPAEQAGRSVELLPLSALEGTLVDPVRALPLENITVGVIPSFTSPKSFLDRSVGPIAITPRAASGVTTADGMFSMPVDPGLVDFTARPSTEAGYPWIVRARVDVPTDSLGTMAPTFPVPIAGRVVDPDGYAVQRAQIRVFALLDPTEPGGISRDLSPKGGQSALQIAEGRTNDTGHFELLLPSGL